MNQTFARYIAAMLALAGSGLGLASTAQAGTQSPGDVLARSVKVLARSPANLEALIAAGKAAFAIGDANAAAGFFGRANEIDPSDPVIKAGLGSVLVALGRPAAAMPYFARARQLGASVAAIGCERGLAYELLGNREAARADYSAALESDRSDEARRRLALSFAVAGDRARALTELQPLLDADDRPTLRTEAFVLALTGDVPAAQARFERAFPGSGRRAVPFLDRLSTLTAAQKLAAVNLGIFPRSDRDSPAGPDSFEPPYVDDIDAGPGPLGQAVGPMEYGGHPRDAPAPAVRRRPDLVLYGVFPGN